VPSSGIELVGIVAVAVMVLCYALEHRGRIYTAIFSFSCATAAAYAYLIESYPFLIAEGLWAIVAARRWYRTPSIGG